MQSASNLRSQLLDLKQRRDDKKRDVREQISEVRDAIDAIDNCKESLTTTPFAAGMSSQALAAVNPAKSEIRATYIANAVDPSKQALVETKNSISEL